MFKRFAIYMLTVLVGALASPAIAQSKDKVILLLNWYTYSEHAPFYLGKERGYFDQEGIDLDIQEGRGSGVTVQAVAAGTATFGYADVPTMIKAAAKGAPVIAVGVALQTSPMSVMGFADKNIRKPEDIKGKTVAVTPGDSMSQIWPLFLKKTNLKDGDFKTVAGDAQTKLNAVINNQADLLLGYVMDQAIKLQDATQKPIYPIKFSDYGINMVSSGIIVQKDLLKSKPELYMPMIDTAEIVSKRYKISREAQDEYSLESQKRIAAAQREGKLDAEIAPLKTTKAIVDKETKAVTYQEVTDPAASVALGELCGRAARVEFFEGHARSGDVRAHKFGGAELPWWSR